MATQKKATVVEANEEQAEQEEPVVEEQEVKAKKPAPEGIGAREVAEAAGITPVELRRFLRSNPELVGGHDAKARCSWASLTDPTVKAIKKQATGNGKGKAAKEPL